MTFIQYVLDKNPGVELSKRQKTIMEFMDTHKGHHVAFARHSPIKRWWSEYEWSKLPLAKLSDDIEGRLYELGTDIMFVHANSDMVEPKAVWLLIDSLKAVANQLTEEMAK